MVSPFATRLWGCRTRLLASFRGFFSVLVWLHHCILLSWFLSSFFLFLFCRFLISFLFCFLFFFFYFVLVMCCFCLCSIFFLLFVFFSFFSFNIFRNFLLPFNIFFVSCFTCRFPFYWITHVYWHSLPGILAMIVGLIIKFLIVPWIGNYFVCLVKLMSLLVLYPKLWQFYPFILPMFLNTSPATLPSNSTEETQYETFFS